MNGLRAILISLALSSVADSQEATFHGLGFPFDVLGLSGDGSTVYGQQSGKVVRWNLAASPRCDGNSPLGLARPYGISYDGSQIVGNYLYRQYDQVIPPFNDIFTVSLYKTFVYSSVTQSYRTLGFLDEAQVTDDSATARDISADGSVIVGSTSSAIGTVAFRWTPGGAK